MTLDYLTSQIAGLRSEAAEVQNRAYRFEKEVDNDTSLSDEGKSERKTANYESFKAMLGTLRDKEIVAVRTRKDSIMQGLFGTTTSNPSDVIAYRDAQDRAQRLGDHTEALATLERATLSGDKSLATAILLKAVDSGWRSVINAYSESNPGTSEALSDLASIAAYEDKSFERTMAYAIFK